MSMLCLLRHIIVISRCHPYGLQASQLGCGQAQFAAQPLSGTADRTWQEQIAKCADMMLWRLAQLDARLQEGSVRCRDPEQAQCSPACATALLQGSLMWLQRPVSEIQVGATVRCLSKRSLQVLAAARSALLRCEQEVARAIASIRRVLLLLGACPCLFKPHV